jgi:hypothetical protein
MKYSNISQEWVFGIFDDYNIRSERALDKN